uniref:Large ribosomal subunit protein uL10 n=1 Tax=Candidatus Kentrum sp. FM TaxID=2126340 RepID=A0A450SQA1_9GAMM|nr:MAG: large subunit ribosomal protein L10 [Candidatus Kentron sp. FM]VFJ63188.1 MAG: large subunit ribosomal protein L10 [Candidatus Kentron sp. FM]VFK12481.1 MAG: large subunit ribosomal protein L10 [Candidatus Kentron sp. FM]
MPLTLEQKKSVVAEVAGIAQNASSVVAAEYRGLTVAEITQLRDQARLADVYLRVVPNRLAYLALDGTDFACIRENLAGPLILAFSRKEAGDSARVLSDFAKKNEKLIVKFAAYGGKLLEGADINALANMPTREVALAILLSAMKAPIAQFVRTLAEPHSRLVRTVDAVRQQKEAA